MITYITAQIIGFLGYLFLITAPNFSEKKQIIQIELIVCALLGTQWALLGQPTLITLNLLNIVITLIVLNYSHKTNQLIPIAYPIGCFILVCVSQGTTLDALCILAFFALTCAKVSEDMFTFRSFSVLAGLTFTLCGALALSIPAMIFNGLFAISHIKIMTGMTLRPQLETQ